MFVVEAFHYKGWPAEVGEGDRDQQGRDQRHGEDPASASSRVSSGVRLEGMRAIDHRRPGDEVTQPLAAAGQQTRRRQ